MRFTCWISKTKTTHIEYWYRFSTATMVSQTRLSVTSYVCCWSCHSCSWRTNTVSVPYIHRHHGSPTSFVIEDYSFGKMHKWCKLSMQIRPYNQKVIYYSQTYWTLTKTCDHFSYSPLLCFLTHQYWLFIRFLTVCRLFPVCFLRPVTATVVLFLNCLRLLSTRKIYKTIMLLHWILLDYWSNTKTYFIYILN
jgi:hypothetical protein